jgi:Zn-dependent M16 (insulinase) family peptidase
MRKVLCYVLSLVLIFSLCLSAAPVVNAAEAGLTPLPEIGQVISGFRTVEIGNMNLLDSGTVLFEHEKTGAKLLYIQSRDTDRSFDISFKTPAMDNTGVNHVLEHISVSGSEKYPMKNVLFTMANQTYCTFINAFTAQNYTTYPVSSMSEEQLLKLTDVYLDCVYHPSVYTDRYIFNREAWRYELADRESDLNISGTVYNEMKGALGNITSAARYNVLKVLFPNSTQSTVSGGDPEKIKDLTYEQVLKTHDAYYQPSNSLMILYGNLDYKKFLEMIDKNYLSKFDKKEVKIDSGKVQPFKQKKDATFSFPSAEGSNTQNASEIDYAFALSNVSEEELVGFSILAEIMNQDTSPLKQEFREKELGEDIKVTFDNQVKQPVLTFSAQNADESRKGEFRSLVDKYIASVIKSGFNRDEVDAVMSAVLLSNSNLTEMSNKGINISTLVGQSWANFDDIDFYNDYIKTIQNISKKTSKKYFENLTQKFIQKNNHAAVVTTVPVAGLAEKQSAKEEERLQSLKASMSSEQIDTIVKETTKYNEWNSREDDKSVAGGLQVVKAADLPAEVKDYAIKDRVADDGARLVTSQANVGETGVSSLVFNTSAVPAEKLHYLQLYANLLGKLDTKAYSKEKLNTLKTRYLNGGAFSLSAIPMKNSSEFTPVLSVSWMGLMGEYDKQLETIKEILLNTQFTDVPEILNNIKTQKANLKTSIDTNPLGMQMTRSVSDFNDYFSYLNYISGLDYYGFLVKLEKKMESDPKTVIDELDAVKDLVINRQNMIAAFSGNKNNIDRFDKSIGLLTKTLPVMSIVKQDYSKLPQPAKREGIAIDGSVQYNMISTTYEKMGTVFSGKYLPIGALINENYTTPNIRFGYGAYDNIVNFSQYGLILASYRDPNIKETFEVYNGLPDFLKNTKITQEELDRYILNAFSQFTAPTGELAGASNAINNYLSGYSNEDILKIINEIKSVTVQDVKDSSSAIENFLKNGTYSTAGSRDKLNENKELFDEIISLPQEQEQNSQGGITRAKFFEIIMTGVPNALDIAKQQGLITPDSKGNYNENRKLTREEMAVFICKIASLSGIQLPAGDISIFDISSASSWSRDRIKAAVSYGVMKLDNTGSFNPKGEVTVEDIQAAMNDMIQKMSGK